MIQRIQSLYLLLALTMMVLTFFIPYAEVLDIATKKLYVLDIEGITEEGAQLFQKTWPMIILVSVSCLIEFFTLFNYKKRILQMRLCTYNVLLMMGSVLLMVYYLLQLLRKHNGEVTVGYSMIFPAVAAILTYLAWRGVRKDEKLVRSVDRVR
jgi:hypothetical protein